MAHSAEKDAGLTWVGAARTGALMAGRVEGQTPAELTKELFDAGRRWAAVRDSAGNVVGVVTRRNGRRSWWAEDATRET